MVQKLSRDKRSVRIVDAIMDAIFVLHDVERTEHEMQLDCIKNKFIILNSLAQACKLTCSELLRLAPKRIFARIT